MFDGSQFSEPIRLSNEMIKKQGTICMQELGIFQQELDF